MALSFRQTDTIPSCDVAAYCSGRSLNATTRGDIAQVGATAGSTSWAIPVNASASLLLAVGWDCIVDAGTLWNAGTWTIRLNVTTLNIHVTWSEVWICRLNSACVSQATIGTSSPAISLS